MPARVLHDIPETACLLGGLHERYVWQLIAANEIGSVKIGRRRLVPREEIDAYIERLRQDEIQARQSAMARVAS